METFNLIEGCIWIGFAIMLPILFRRQTAFREQIALFFAFLGFGISDFIEIQTGAWWHPWWLFLLKAVCLLSIIVLMTQIYKKIFTKSLKK